MSTDVQLRDYLAVIKKYDFVICLCLIVTVGCALSVSLYLPKDYIASTLVLLVQPTSSANVSSANVFQSVLSGGLNRGEIDTIKQRFSADSTLKYALQRLEETNSAGVQQIPSLGQLKEGLSAKNLPDTDFIEISLKVNESKGGARLAAALTNQLVWDMQDMRESEDFSRTEHRRAFLTKKLSDLVDEIREEEKRAFEFVREQGSPIVWQAEVANALAERAELVKTETESNQMIYGAKNELVRLKSELKKYPEFAKTSESANLDPQWSQYHERLITLKIDLKGLEAKFGRNSKEVQAHQSQIDELRKELASFETDLPLRIINETRSVSPVYASLQEKVLSQQSILGLAESSITTISQQLIEVERRIAKIFANIPESELLYQQLNRKISTIADLSKEVYRQSLDAEIFLAESEFWRKNKTQREIKGGIEIVDPAVPRKMAVFPRLKLVVLIAGIAGLSLGMSVALIAEYLAKPVLSEG